MRKLPRKRASKVMFFDRQKAVSDGCVDEILRNAELLEALRKPGEISLWKLGANQVEIKVVGSSFCEKLATVW